MKRTLVVIFILFFTAAGAFYYFKNYRHQNADIWQLVPSNAVIAYENTGLIDNWNKVIDKSIWKTLKKMPYFSSWEKGLTFADSVSGKDGTLDKLFRDKTFIVSVHITSSRDFDFLFSLELNGPEGKATFNKVIKSILQDNSIVSKSRNYQGLELKELTEKSGESTFTYFIYENVVVGSFTPFLVEDVVRNITSGFKETFQSQIASLNGISKLENDEGNIYIDFSKLPDLFSTFLKEEDDPQIQHMLKFSGDTYLDIKVTDNELLLNGISAVDLSNNHSFIGTFRNQNPGRIKVTDLLPNATALLYHVSFSDFKDWQNNLAQYRSFANKEQFERALDFENKYELNLDWIGSEAAHCILETPNKEEPDQLIFVSVNDKDLVFDEMTRFAETLSREMNDSVYIEMYNDLPIIQIPVAEFPAMILGDYFLGFANSFVTLYDDYLVVGNSMQTVKNFLNDLENENNWGKSVRLNMFLDNTLSESSFSMMINTSLCWPMIMRNLNDKWTGLFKSYESQLKSFDLIALQVSNLDKRFYTSIAVGHQERAAPVPKSGRLKKVQSVYTMAPIVTKPFIVKNHNNNRFEVLLQDSLDILYQISPEGEVLWGDSIRDRIVSDIMQVDYYKNGKLQYLFATKDKIHLLDRNGDYVENYPIKVGDDISLSYLSVIDYDNSKRYRFMAVDDKGNLYMFNKEGKNLEGWTPRKTDAPLVIPAFHLRVKGGDCIIALQRNGVLNVMNRRGEMQPGFPLDLKAHGVNDLFVDIGNDFESTKLITVSDEGELIAVNLEGKVVSREQLYKPSKDSKFWLVVDALKKTYLIARQEYNKISLLDRKGDLFMEKELISSGELYVQYYNFSTDNQIVIVIDREQEFAFIYDRDFESVTFEPAECSHPIGLLYAGRQKEYRLYKCYKNNFSIELFK